MALIEIAEAGKIDELLITLKQEAATSSQQLKKKKEQLVQIKEFLEDYHELERNLTATKNQLFEMINSQMKSRRIHCFEAYKKALEADIEGLGAGGKK